MLSDQTYIFGIEKLEYTLHDLLNSNDLRVEGTECESYGNR